MKISYYPGCTLKTKARNLDRAAIVSLEALGIEVEEIDRWNCCGAVYSLTADDLIHMVGPVRNLIRAKEQGADRLVTLCSMCYNTLARANRLMREDAVKRDTINRFMDDEIDYSGEVEVVHARKGGRLAETPRAGQGAADRPESGSLLRMYPAASS